MNKFNIRYGAFFRGPRQIAKHVLSWFYPLVIKIWPLPKIKSKEETIEKIVKEKRSIARFGDSEILYITDKLNLPYQEYDKELASIMKEILSSDVENLLVGLPNAYLPPSIKRPNLMWKSQIAWNYPRFQRVLNLNKQYYNASITRLYYKTDDLDRTIRLFNQIRSIWDNKEVLIIEGEKSRFGVGNDLLDNAKSVERILGPYHHAFRKFNEMLNAAKKHSKDKLILIAMGPTAKALAYYLTLDGYQAVDIGNLDLEYEWYRMGVSERVKVKGKYTSEVKGGREVEDITDLTYESQIIERYSL